MVIWRHGPYATFLDEMMTDTHRIFNTSLFLSETKYLESPGIFWPLDGGRGESAQPGPAWARLSAQNYAQVRAGRPLWGGTCPGRPGHVRGRPERAVFRGEILERLARSCHIADT